MRPGQGCFKGKPQMRLLNRARLPAATRPSMPHEPWRPSLPRVHPWDRVRLDFPRSPWSPVLPSSTIRIVAVASSASPTRPTTKKLHRPTIEGVFDRPASADRLVEADGKRNGGVIPNRIGHTYEQDGSRHRNTYSPNAPFEATSPGSEAFPRRRTRHVLTATSREKWASRSPAQAVVCRSSVGAVERGRVAR